MKDISEIFSSMEGSRVELQFLGADTGIETGRIVFAGTDYVALEPREGEDPDYIPFTSIRLFRIVRG
ncbi:MAG: hypothetical protein ACYTHK_12285 [Planctomycetota bacterium]|jgi:hypothetical protein